MLFPSRVSHLILASPVGVPNEPATLEPSRRGRISLGWRLARGLIGFIWNRGYTPLSIVRLIGPMGPRPVNAYVTQRFLVGPAVEETPPMTSEAGLETSAALSEQIDRGNVKLPKTDVAKYLVSANLMLTSSRVIFVPFQYHLCAQPGSGEYALPRVLKPSIFAYDPLENRLGQSDVTKVTFLYGDHDWMDAQSVCTSPSSPLCTSSFYSAGQRTVESLNARVNSSESAQLLVVPQAGHQMMIDNPDGFHRAIERALVDGTD